MAEIERMTVEEVVRHLLADADGADLARESLRWLVQRLIGGRRTAAPTSSAESSPITSR